jgi:hypothetical protein
MSWKDIKQLKWRELEIMLEYWSHHPTVHELLALYMGIKIEDTSPNKPSTNSNSSSSDFLKFFEETGGDFELINSLNQSGGMR